MAEEKKKKKWFFKGKSTSVKSKFDKKNKVEKRRLEEVIKEFLEKAGVEQDPKEVNKKLIMYVVSTLVVLTVSLITIATIISTNIIVLIGYIVLLWTVFAATIYLLFILALLVYLDLKIFKRTKEIEDVLPDFLQLTSANIRAGMPIDKALWYSVRPQFGVLSKEIEEVAKATIAGEDLEVALKTFSKKYDSRTLKEAVNLLIEGMRAGGEIGDLLNKISINIQEIKLMKKEISASVMTYVIFISVAAIAAAPVLLALSTQLLIIIGKITSSLDLSQATSGGSMFTLSLSGDSISIASFETFALLMIVITTFFSASIISIIRKGTIKEGIKLIPVYITVAIVIYYISTWMFGSLMSGFF